jgi:hypothetical protein
MSATGMQASVELPPLHYHSYPVDIHIRIYREGATYGADIQAVGRILRVSIGMSPHDLKALNKQLQKVMETVARDSAQSGVSTTAEKEEQLRRLAEIGNYAFRRIFSNNQALTAIQSVLTLSSRVSIQIASEDFFLPWELIYPVSLDKPLSYQNFWGINYVISRVIVQDAHPGAFVSPVIPIDRLPKLGLLTYSGLEHVRREIGFFEELDRSGKIALFKLRPLDPSKKREELQEFRCFWSNALNLAHFACHAFYEDESPDQSRILLSDEFPISLLDMEVYSITIDNHPLIIMNACETGNMNPLYTSHFATTFLRYGARGVVATECSVPDAFAADFAEQLYTHLLAGEPLGESLLATRGYFLRQHHNPSGLLYSMYAPPSLQLAQSERASSFETSKLVLQRWFQVTPSF